MDFSFDELSVALSYAVTCGSCTGAAPQQNKAKENKKEDKKAAAPAAAKADEFDDLFGDDEPAAAPAPAVKADDLDNIFEDDEGLTAEEADAARARKARMEAARKLKEEKDAKEGKKKDKVKAVEKSLVVLEVKPWEADTDLKMVWEKIKEYQQEGLTWGENFKLEPVAFGIKKLVMTCVIVDAQVVMDDITENIEALDQWVQSVEVASMNKIS